MKLATGMDPVKLQRANIRVTADGHEATPVPKRLPRTIEDSIRLTKALGARYLWIDALCIVQDDSDEIKKIHLEKMDAIYSCSVVTIAAASGHHADCGLPGVTASRWLGQNTETVKPFMTLASMSPSFSQLENSQLLVWNTRGWTFQEKILAKRIILFTDYQVYFRCSESIWTEEVYMETDRLSKRADARRGKYRW